MYATIYCSERLSPLPTFPRQVKEETKTPRRVSPELHNPLLWQAGPQRHNAQTHAMLVYFSLCAIPQLNLQQQQKQQQQKSWSEHDTSEGCLAKATIGFAHRAGVQLSLNLPLQRHQHR
jgi:hypothetical protein